MEFEEDDAVFDEGCGEADGVVELDFVLSQETQRVKAVGSREESRVQLKGVFRARRDGANTDGRGLILPQQNDVTRAAHSFIRPSAQKYLARRRQ